MIGVYPRFRQPWVRNGAGGPARLVRKRLLPRAAAGGTYCTDDLPGNRAAGRGSGPQRSFTLQVASDQVEDVGETGADRGESKNGGNGDQRGD